MAESPGNLFGNRRPLGLGFFDLGAVLLAAALTVLSGALVYGGGEADRVLVQGEGGRWIFPRSAGEVFTVPGPLGDTVVELRDGEARILSSPCVNQTCVAAGHIRFRGQWLVCLPNRVFVSVEGRAASGDDGPDALAW